MSSELRFHVATLIAVFLALGIGILIGTFFVGAPVVERQMRGLTKRLGARVTELQQQTEEARKNEDALRTLLPPLVAGRLEGQKVLVVQTGDYVDAAERAEESLKQAGAAIARIVLPREAWSERLAAGPEDAPPAERLAALLLSPNRGAVFEEFRRTGLLTGEPPPGPYRSIVLIGGAQTPAGGPGSAGAAADPTTLIRVLDVALAKAWQASGITVVGAEPLGAGISYMRPYQAQGMATVDNIDRAAGQICLPFALSGDKGTYGMKATAERLLPASLEAPPAASATSPP